MSMLSLPAKSTKVSSCCFLCHLQSFRTEANLEKALFLLINRNQMKKDLKAS